MGGECEKEGRIVLTHIEILYLKLFRSFSPGTNMGTNGKMQSPYSHQANVYIGS